MGFIDTHTHSIFLSFRELQAMASNEYEAVVTLSYTPYRPRSPDSLADHFEHVALERERLRRLGLHCLVGFGLHPRCIPPSSASRYLRVVEDYVQMADVVGEVGLETASNAEIEVLKQQLRMADKYDKPVIVHTPRAGKLRAVKKVVEVLKECTGAQRVVVDHLTPNPEIVRSLTGLDVYLGITLQPGKASRRDVAFLLVEHPDVIDRVVLNSDAGREPSDALSVKKAYAYLASSLGAKVAFKVTAHNARALLGI